MKESDSLKRMNVNYNALMVFMKTQKQINVLLVILLAKLANQKE